MKARIGSGPALAVCMVVAQLAISPAAPAQGSGALRVSSDQTVGGFAFPE